MTDPVLRAVAKMREDGFDVSPTDVRAMLATLLYDEEIASVIWASDYEVSRTAFTNQDCETREEYFRNASALRAFFLGEDK